MTLRDRFRRKVATVLDTKLAEEDGQSMVEAAVTLPVLFTLLFCFMEMCLAFYSHNMISELAREGTRYAMVRGASCLTTASASCQVTTSQVNSFVSGIGFPNLGGGTITPVASYPDGNAAIGSRVQVLVTYVFPITMPFVPTSSITMTSTSVATIVQ
jgi:Flp pilus assembly protein TadG